MSTATIHVPEATSEFVVDARTFTPKRKPRKEGCRYCGGPIPEDATPPRHCSPSHRKKAAKARNAGEPLHYEPEHCFCGEDITGRPRVVAFYCSRRCRTRWLRYTRPFDWFRSRVKWAHPLSRLAEKLGLPEDDPRLPDIALQMAEAGKIIVFIGDNGLPGAYGKPEKPRSRDSGLHS